MKVTFHSNPKVQLVGANHFLKIPEFDPHSGLPNWIVLEDFKIETSLGSFTVPQGFVTDMASVPKFFWRLIPPFQPDIQAQAVGHDFIWEQQGRLFQNRCAWTFEMSNDFLQTGCRSLGMPWWKRWLVRKGVDWFGKDGWNHCCEAYKTRKKPHWLLKRT